MTTLSVRETERLAHRAELALTLAILVGAIEVVRRAPAWLLVLVAGLLTMAVLMVAPYVWWIVGALATAVGWKLARGLAHGWHEAR